MKFTRHRFVSVAGSEILPKALKREGTENLFFIMGSAMLLAEEQCIKVKSFAAFPAVLISFRAGSQQRLSYSRWCTVKAQLPEAPRDGQAELCDSVSSSGVIPKIR